MLVAERLCEKCNILPLSTSVENGHTNHYRGFVCSMPSIRDGVLGMLLYLHRRNSKLFFHPAKFDNFKDEKISDFKTVSVSQRKNLLD